MQKIKHFTCVYYNYTVLLFCSKRCQTKFNALFDNKINNRKKLKSIVINHSADIDYGDFMRIYREYTREPFNFLTTDATLPVSNLEKN